MWERGGRRGRGRGHEEPAICSRMCQTPGVWHTAPFVSAAGANNTPFEAISAKWRSFASKGCVSPPGPELMRSPLRPTTRLSRRFSRKRRDAPAKGVLIRPGRSRTSSSAVPKFDPRLRRPARARAHRPRSRRRKFPAFFDTNKPDCGRLRHVLYHYSLLKCAPSLSARRGRTHPWQKPSPRKKAS